MATLRPLAHLSLSDNDWPDLSTRNRQVYPRNSVAPTNEKAPPLPKEKPKKQNTTNSDERYGHQKPKIGYKNKQVPKRKRSESTTCAIKIMAPAFFTTCVLHAGHCEISMGMPFNKESIEFASPAPQ
jgi:hypothetical protein